MALEVQPLRLYSGCLFPARSGFTPGWVYVHVGGGVACLIIIDIVVFDYIPFPVFTHTTGMTLFQFSEVHVNSIMIYLAVSAHFPFESGKFMF